MTEIETPAPERSHRRWSAPATLLDDVGLLAVGDQDAPTRRVALPRWMALLSLMALQITASMAMTLSPQLALVQALAIMAVAGWAILQRNLILMLSVVAYLAGTEVLWRQIRPPIPYLLGPYLVIGLSAFGCFVVLGQVGRQGRLALLYGSLLIPSILLTFRTAGSNAREFVVFALSGPFALALLVAVCSQLRVEPWLHRRLLWTVLIGILGPWAVAITEIQQYIVNTGSIDFAGGSNFITSGNFGPVQVSSVLGLGVLVSILLVMSERTRTVRLLAVVAGTVLAVQSFLTFSRGGMSAVGIAVAVLVVVLTRDRENRRRIYGLLSVMLLVGWFLIIPQLESFTGGAFGERFTDTKTERTDLATNDLEIFQRHLLFGVGPGMTKFQRLTYEICQIRTDSCDTEASSHTEFTRELSEHGLPGVLAITLLVVLVLRTVLRRSRVNQALAATLAAWALAQMAYANLRVVAVPIALGFAFLTVVDPDDSEGAGDRRGERAPSVEALGHGRPAPPLT